MKERKEFFLFLFFCFFSGILVFLDKRGWIRPARGVLERPILTVEEKIYGLKIWGDSLMGPIFQGKAFEREITQLQLELQRLAVEKNQLSVCLEENEKMRKLLGAPLPPAWKFLPAKVVGLAEKMRIDKGRKDGIEEGMVVLSENILLGKIVSVNRGASLVQLPTMPGVKIPVAVKRTGSSGVQARGLLLGQYGGRLVLDRVLQSEDIQKGDLVVTSGDESWPADLLIGQITEVLPKSAEIYQKAQVKPLLDYDKLRIVFIVISN